MLETATSSAATIRVPVDLSIAGRSADANKPPPLRSRSASSGKGGGEEKWSLGVRLAQNARADPLRSPTCNIFNIVLDDLVLIHTAGADTAGADTTAALGSIEARRFGLMWAPARLWHQLHK